MTGEDARRAEVTRRLRDVVRSVLTELEPEEVRMDLHPKDLGADSVDRVEIIQSVRAEFGLTTPLAHFADLRNLGEIVDLVMGQAVR